MSVQLVHWREFTPGMIIKNCCRNPVGGGGPIPVFNGISMESVGLVLSVYTPEYDNNEEMTDDEIGITLHVLWTSGVQAETPFFDDWHAEVLTC